MRKFRLRTLRWLALLLFIGLLAAVCLRWVSLERWRWNSEHPPEVLPALAEETPTPEPRPRTRVVAGRLDTARLFNGITLRTTVAHTIGRAASEERADPESYVLDLKLNVRTPTPNRTVEELAAVNSALPRLLPGLTKLIIPEAVSPYFAEFYEIKLRSLRQNLSRLDQLLSRHNFYDCQTILRLRDPESKRKAVLLQSDMDVDSDGSDSDRLPTTTAVSTTFQPTTSYRWPKKTKTPNPYLPPLEEKLQRWQTETSARGTSAERKRELKNALAQVRDEIGSLKSSSFLIGSADPFIVVPGGFTKAEEVKIGDYAVVVSEDAIYPAIVGDIGPTDKAGEASLRIAKEISASATANNRPTEDLKITYLIFPGTAETTFAAPDLDKIGARCAALVNEIGGAGIPLHKWVSNLPTPTPTPTPTPVPTPTPSPSPQASPASEGSPSPSATFAFPLPSTSPSPTTSPSPSSSPTPSDSPSAAVVRHKKHRKS
ncbi:MAG: glycoside hydrolase family 75 protein [Chthoniobacterales bacterium]